MQYKQQGGSHEQAPFSSDSSKTEWIKDAAEKQQQNIVKQT